MKIKKVVLVLFVMLFSNTFAADKYEDLRNLMLWENLKKYEIKAMKVTQVQYEYGVPLNYGYIIKDYKFDKKMNIVESKYYKKDDYRGKFVYEYTSEDDTLKITNFDDDNKEIYRTEFTYDNNGFLKEKQHFKKMKPDFKEEYSFDSDGNLLEYKKYKKDEINFILKYKYIAHGNEIETVFNEVEFERYDDENNKEMNSVSSYNEKGLKTDSTFYFRDLEDLKVEFSYDNNDRLIEKKSTSPKVGLLERFTYKYSAKGQLFEEKRYDDQDVMVEMFVLDYADDGQLEKIEIYEEKEFMVGIWRFTYHLNGLLKDEHYYNKLDIPQFLRQYDYEPVQQ